MKAKNLKRSDAADNKTGFPAHVAGTVRCSCSTCRSSIWQRVGNASSIRFHSVGSVWYEKNNIFSVLSQSRRGGRETFGLCIVAQRNVEPDWVMPAGYIEPRKIVFHRRRVPHQTCGMNWQQELPEDSQIWPRKPSRPSASCKSSLQPQQ